jgi:DNA-binding NtrC family response regulator
MRRLADSDAAVLISGERGTGKAMVARALHHQSRRHDQPLVTVDCALSEEVLLKEVFKEVETEISGSNGVILRGWGEPQAGTLYLKDLEKMPVLLQRKLSVALLGALPRTNSTGVRILAGSSALGPKRDSTALFVTELTDRMTRLHLPALRDRADDILPLARYFLRRLAASGETPKNLSVVVGEVLQQYSWPENVRELQNTLQSASLAVTGNTLLLGDLPDKLLNAVDPRLVDVEASSRRGAVVNMDIADVHSIGRVLFQWARVDGQFKVIPSVERELIVQAMEQTRGNQVQAASLLGITRATLRKRLERLNIQRKVSYE